MIYAKAIEVYLKYAGYSDALSHCASDDEKSAIGYKDWRELDGLVQDFKLIEKGLTSNEFKDSLAQRLKKSIASQGHVDALKKLAFGSDDAPNI